MCDTMYNAYMICQRHYDQCFGACETDSLYAPAFSLRSSHIEIQAGQPAGSPLLALHHNVHYASVTLVPAFIPTSILSTVLLVQLLTTPSISSFRTLHPSTPNSNISSNRSTCNLVSICANVIFPLVGKHATTKFGKSASSGWERSNRGCVRCRPMERDVV